MAVDPKIWLQNLTNHVSDLIEEQQNDGYMVVGICMTKKIKSKMETALGHEPSDFLGYVIHSFDEAEPAEEIGVLTQTLH